MSTGTPATATISVAIANIQNFPNLPDPAVRKVAAGVRDLCDLALLSEIGEAKDHKAVREVFGPEWAKTKTAREVPIVHRLSVLEQVGKSQVLPMSPSLGAGSNSPARYLTREVFRFVDAPAGVPLLEVHAIHYVQAAWSPKAVPMKAQRQKNWTENWGRQRDLALAARAAGRIVIFGGDWNRQGTAIPLFAPDQKWVIGGKQGIDHLAVLLPKGVTVRATNRVTEDTASDHHTHAVDLKFTVQKTTPTPTQPEVPTMPANRKFLDKRYVKMLRDAGLTVVELDGWETRSRPASTGTVNFVGGLHHHTGPGISGLAGAKWLALTGRPDLPPPLSQVSSARDGTIYLCAAGRANHAGVAKASGTVAAGDGNELYVGFEHQNSGSEGWSKDQYDAMVTLAAVTMEYLGTSEKAQRAHKETSVTGKWDPGMLDMDDFRADVKVRHAQLYKGAPVPTPTPEAQKTPNIAAVVKASRDLFAALDAVIADGSPEAKKAAKACKADLTTFRTDSRAALKKMNRK